MTRKEMLDKLSTIDFVLIWPPSEWGDIGFTERPIWLNSKGYGYVSCDESIAWWCGTGVDQVRWEAIKQKISDGTLTMRDMDGTSLISLIKEFMYEDLDNLPELLEGLLEIKGREPERLYGVESILGWHFFETEQDFKRAYERDWCDYEWDDLEEEVLSRWIQRLFTDDSFALDRLNIEYGGI